jgi:aspartate aminotransferase
MARIKASPTVAAAARAAELQAAGLPVISLTTGEPDFPTPAHIRAAAVAAMEAGQTRYTNVDGTPALKDAIRAKFLRENGISYARDEVIASTGAKQAIFNAVLACVAEGDEVIIPTPAWVSYIDIVKLAGGTPVELPFGPQAGFKPDADAIAAAITPATRMILLNSPCNPTGAVLSADELSAIGRTVEGRPDILIVCDDIYEHILYTEAPFATMAQVCPHLRDQVLTVNGVSKAFAMTGWRIGYAGGPRHIIAAMKVLQGQSTTNPNSVAQAAAAAALNGGTNTVEEMRQAFARRRDAMLARFRAMPGLTVHPPEGAFYLFLGIADLLGRRTPAGKVLATEADVADHILTEANVALVGGAGFGLSPYLRLSFAAADDVLQQAADRIAAALAALDPAPGQSPTG